MASAASLLTPHMLTEAYASLLAALTAWDPTEGETQTCLDEDKPEMDRKTKGYSGSDRVGHVD